MDEKRLKEIKERASSLLKDLPNRQSYARCLTATDIPDLIAEIRRQRKIILDFEWKEMTREYD